MSDKVYKLVEIVGTSSGSLAEAASAGVERACQTLHHVDWVEVDKIRQTLKLFDKQNGLIGFFPATVGSEEKPSPSGTLKVTEVSRNPTYRYNPDYQFKGVRSRTPFKINPGPNNPVGTVWINLSANGYGIHGTAIPGKVSKSESHGCIRLTNWDAERVADRVAKGTQVSFLDGAR